MYFSSIEKRVSIVYLTLHEKLPCYTLTFLLNKIFYKLLFPSYKNTIRFVLVKLF